MRSSPELLMTTSNIQVFDIKRFSTHDGAGIRTTIFFKGCPLRCRWCQNPEGLSPSRQVLYMENKCIRCLSCVHASMHHGVLFKDGQIHLDRRQDEDWEKIVDACPTRALQFDSSSYTVDQLLHEIEKDEAFFKHGGGVTISGGEPFLQPEGLIGLLKACKAHGYHTAIETSLFTELSWVKEAIVHLDQIYADCKIFDEEKHKEYTGVKNDKIKENIAFLLSSKVKDRVIIRTPLIPDMTATDQNIKDISKFISSLYPDVHYEILNYNPLAQSKYAYLDLSYCFEDNPKMYSSDVMEHFYEIARDNGIKNLEIE